MAVKQSERYLSASDMQMDYSRVYKDQTKSIMEFYDSIIQQADLLSDTIAKMNYLLINILPQIEQIISDSQGMITNFSENEIGKMMVCVNIVCALSELIGVPVVNEDGLLYQEGIKMVAIGQDKIRKVESVLSKF